MELSKKQLRLDVEVHRKLKILSALKDKPIHLLANEILIKVLRKKVQQ